MLSRLSSAVASLAPGYFALVMATGIISMGLHVGGMRVASLVVLALTGAAFAVLIVLSVWRIVAFRRRMVSDFRSTARAFDFFTFVAGANVLAARVAVEGWFLLAGVLLALACLFWVFFGYAVPWNVVVDRHERPVVSSANGTWFVWVVASQSVTVVAAQLEDVYTDISHELSVVAVLSWAVGIFLYAACAVFVSLRLMLYRFRAEDLDPPYWVTMGALAITIVAGAEIIRMGSSPMVDATRELVSGMSVLFWCFATWLIPVLVAMGWWRHVVRKVPLRYEAALWSIIFPLGMYAVASMDLGTANGLPVVSWIGERWLWIAVAAWAVTFVAMVWHITRTVIVTRATNPVKHRPIG